MAARIGGSVSNVFLIMKGKGESNKYIFRCMLDQWYEDKLCDPEFDGISRLIQILKDVGLNALANKIQQSPTAPSPAPDQTKDEMGLKNDEMGGGKKHKAGLIIVNSEYEDLHKLDNPENDGEMMQDMLEKAKYMVKIVRNSDNILQDIKEFIQESKDSSFEIFHLHYSGHGVHNAIIPVDVGKFRTEFDDELTEITTYEAARDAPSGDCLVGIRGKLCPVDIIKRKVLDMTCERWTMTLDMCRGRPMRGSQKIYQMELPYLPPIPRDKESRLAVIFGTTDLHPASDYHSFTSELHTVVNKEYNSIAFASIVKKVNKSWASKNIEQLCKEDIVHVGDNWEQFMWPSDTPDLV